MDSYSCGYCRVYFLWRKMKKGFFLEIKASDEFWNVFFKKKIKIDDKKEVDELLDELAKKGIDLRKLM